MFLCLCLRVKYQNHISYFHSVHTLVSDGFTVINFPVCCGGMHKNVQTLILTQKSNQSDFRRKLWLFYVCMIFVMRKTDYFELIRFLNLGFFFFFFFFFLFSNFGILS